MLVRCPIFSQMLAALLPYLAVLLLCSAQAALPGTMETRLTHAALRVIQTHAGPVYPAAKPVPVFSSQDIMYSNRNPRTSAGDREELQVTKLMLSAVKTDLYGAARWSYIHHNHTEYLMAATRNNVHLWRLTGRNADLKTTEALFRYNFGVDELVDAIAFARNERNQQTMYLVFVVRTGMTGKLMAYEVDTTGQVMLLAVPLAEVPLKVRWLESQQQGALVLLYSSAYSDISLSDFRQGSTVLSHIIHIHVPMAVDLETTIIGGYGYIAVSNATTVAVYRSDELANSFRLFDMIHGPELTDIALFRVGFESLMAVAGRTEQFLYVWRGGGFFLRQVFSVRGSYQWYPVTLSSCRDDVLLTLATADMAYSLRIFAWSPQHKRFNEVDRGTVPLGGFLVLKDSAASYSIKDNAWIVFTDAVKGSPKIIGISTKVALLPNPVEERGSQIVLRMNAAKEYLDKQQALLNQASRTFQNAVSPQKPVNILQMRHVLKNLLVNGPVAMGFSHLEGLVVEGSPVSMTELNDRMPLIRKAIGDLGFRIRRLTAALKDGIFKNSTASIPAAKVVSGSLVTPELRAKESDIGALRGVPTAEFLRNTYRADRPVQVVGRVRIAKPSKVKGDLQASLVNGVDLRNAVTVDRHHTLTGKNVFVKPLSILKDSILEGTLNGVKPSSFATLSGNHYFTAPKQFGPVTVQKELSVLRLDGVDIVSTVRNTLNSVDNQSVSGLLMFQRNVQTRDIFSATVNSLHVPDLPTRFVRLDKPSSIRGFKTFTNFLQVDAPVTIGGKLNGLSIPYDLLLRDAEQVVKGRKRFGRLITGVTSVDGRVSGLKLPSDVYRITDDGNVDVRLAFHRGIDAARDIHVKGMTDSVDISEFARYISTQPDKTIKTDAIFKGPVVVRGSMTVGGFVNRVLLDGLYKDAIFPGDGKVLAITGKKIFHEGIDVAHMTVKGSVNGYSLLEDFLATEDHQDIEGRKVFMGPVTFERDLNSSTGIVDGVDVFGILSGRVTLHSEQNITAEPVFVDTVHVERLYTWGRIQGVVVPRDLILKSVPQRVYGVKHFSHGFKGKVVDARIRATVTGPVAGRDIVKVYQNRVSLDGHEAIAHPIVIGNVTAPFFGANLLNGRQVQDFLSNVMSRSQPQVVAALKTFEGKVEAVAPVSSAKGVNGVHLSEVNRNAVKLSGLSVITQPISFKDALTVFKVSVRGTVDGRDIKSFEADTVPKKGWATIRGNSVFYKGFKVQGNIATDSFNDLMLGYDVLLRSTDQTVKGRYSFAKNVKVLEDLPHTGHVNGVDLSVLDMLVMKVNRENVLRTNLEFSQLVEVATDVDVDGFVNGHKLSSIKDEAVCNAGPHDILGPKVIHGPVTMLSSLNAMVFNNRSLPQLLDDIVLTDGSYMTAPKAFENLIVQGNIKARDVHFGKLVNGIPVQRQLSTALFLAGKCEATDEKIFKQHFKAQKNLTVQGTINAVRIPQDIVQLCHTKACPLQHLTSPTFESLQVPGHLPVSNHVNGHNLPQALKNTLGTFGNQTISGMKHIQNAQFKRNVMPRHVSGKLFHKEVVPLRTPQMLHSVLAPADIVTTNVIVKGLVNDYSIQNLVRNALYLNRPQTIPAPVTLGQVVVQADVHLHGLINGIALPIVHQELVAFDNSVAQLGHAMSQKIRAHGEVISELNCFLKDSYSFVDHFVVYQFLNVEATMVDAETGVTGLRLVDAHAGSPESHIYYFSWGKDKLWHLQSEAAADEGRRIYFRLQGRLLWLEEPLPDSPIKRGILTDGTTVIHNFGDVVSMSALQWGSGTGLVASLTRNGVCDIFSFTLRTEMMLIGTLNPGPEAQTVKLVTLEGSVYAVVSLYDPQACLTETVRSKIYVWESADKWSLIQQLYGGAVTSFFVKNGMLYALFTDVDMHNRCNMPSVIKVYRTCGSKGSLLELFQVLPMVSVSNVDIVEYGAQLDVYMVAANRTTINFYHFAGEAGFQLQNTISVKGLSDAKLLVLQHELYLVTAQGYSSGKSVIYKAATKGAKETFKFSQLS